MQEINGKSFRLLQEYLNETNSSCSVSSKKLFHFHFFVQVTLPGSRCSHLERVEVTVPWQTGNETVDAEGATFTTVAKLLKACSDVAKGKVSGKSRMGLFELFRIASEAQQSADPWTGPEDRHIIAIRNALRVGRNILVSFQGQSVLLSSRERMEALESFTSVLDSIPDKEVSHCAVVIGEKSGADLLGNIWLKHGETPEKWGETLLSTNMAVVRKNRQSHFFRRGKEASVARLLGVEMIFTDDKTMVNSDYGSLLELLEAEAREKGPVGKGAYQGIPLMVLPAELQNLHWTVDLKEGLLKIPMKSSYGEIEAFLKENGELATRVRRKKVSNAERMKEMQDKLRQSLKLRHIGRSPEVSDEQFLMACYQLHNCTSALRPVSEGLTIFIAHRSFIGGEGKPTLYLDWNFQPSDL